MTKEKRKPTGILKDGATEVVFTVLNLILCKQQFFHTKHFFFSFPTSIFTVIVKLVCLQISVKKKGPKKKR